MSFTTFISSFALCFYAVSFVTEKLKLRGRRVKTDLDRGSLALYDVTGLLSVPSGIVLGFTDYGRVRYGPEFIAASGLCMLVAGTLLRRAAVRQLWDYFTLNVSILEGQRIVRRGLYGRVRHPSYAGLLLRYLGLGLAFANWASAALIFLPILCATVYRMRVEEEALARHFGEEYTDYCRETRRLVPGVY
jgi:protein-S-isoprenylcysteine O-methyltransferase Ste14